MKTETYNCDCCGKEINLSTGCCFSFTRSHLHWFDGKTTEGLNYTKNFHFCDNCADDKEQFIKQSSSLNKEPIYIN